MMKLLLAVLSIFFVTVSCTPDQECEKDPVDRDDELCCKMPELCDDGIFEVCNKEIAFKNYDLVMRNCKIYECVIKAHNLTDGEEIVEEKLLSYFDVAVSDQMWKPIIKKATQDCFSATTNKLEDLKQIFAASPYNIKSDECNIKIMAFVECHMTNSYVSCPEPFWNDNSRCNATKSLLTKCNSNIENVAFFYSKHM